ncbi:MAG: hypothetical protein J0L96_02860 [Anaerolineae bacterium]|nr:hypothetical protein [Anaerolineae bacterium]
MFGHYSFGVTNSQILQQAVLETLAYSDVFDYPLTFDELHRYLTASAPPADLAACLSDMSVVATENGFYFLAARHEIVRTRMGREQASRAAFQRACWYGAILGSLPFVRMVTLTGSLAMLNLNHDADMDYMLVTQPGRLWLARAFAVLFGRLMRIFGDRICVNLLVSESALEWHPRDLYSAREMCQMIPLTGLDVYQRLRAANTWTKSFLPNADSAPALTPEVKSTSVFQQWLEIPLRGKLGDALEGWSMNLQLKKIMHTYGTGIEANFSADLCQGNFHDHRRGTENSFNERLALLSEGEPRA